MTRRKSSRRRADIRILVNTQLTSLVRGVLQLGRQSVSVKRAWTFTSCPSPASQVSLGRLPNGSENQFPSLWNRKQNYGVGVLWESSESMYVSMLYLISKWRWQVVEEEGQSLGKSNSNSANREHALYSRRAILHSGRARPVWFTPPAYSFYSSSVLYTCYLEACSLSLIKSNSVILPSWSL